MPSFEPPPLSIRKKGEVGGSRSHQTHRFSTVASHPR